jgi:hypothetical protein
MANPALRRQEGHAKTAEERGRLLAAPVEGPHLQGMFVFFSNKLGCLGSIAISAALTGVLFLVMRGCNSFPQ